MDAGTTDAGTADCPDGPGCAPQGCSPSTCDGCCSGDTCLAGDSSAACGAGGVTCSDCGADHVCTAGACEIDPASTWDLAILWAEVASVDDLGTAWDPFDGLPDPYVEAWIGPVHAVTSTAHDTLDPTWQVWVPGVTATMLSSVVVGLWDDDADADDPMGSCAGTANAALFAGERVDWSCADAPSWILTVQLVPH